MLKIVEFDEVKRLLREDSEEAEQSFKEEVDFEIPEGAHPTESLLGLFELLTVIMQSVEWVFVEHGIRHPKGCACKVALGALVGVPHFTMYEKLSDTLDEEDALDAAIEAWDIKHGLLSAALIRTFMHHHHLCIMHVGKLAKE